jgi:hypothetical protein
MTRHWIEAYVDTNQVSFRLECADRENCTDTAESSRGTCAVQDWFNEDGTHLLCFPADKQEVLGQVDVMAWWRGYGEDAELELRPATTRRLSIKWHRDAIEGAAKRITEILSDTAANDIAVINGKRITMMDLYCLRDAANAVLADMDES